MAQATCAHTIRRQPPNAGAPNAEAPYANADYAPAPTLFQNIIKIFKSGGRFNGFTLGEVLSVVFSGTFPCRRDGVYAQSAAFKQCHDLRVSSAALLVCDFNSIAIDGEMMDGFSFSLHFPFSSLPPPRPFRSLFAVYDR